jgi:acetolactate synthase-1/2/3 large subunit
MELTGAQILIECLKKEKVDVLFGYQGGKVIPIFDVLYTEPTIKVIVPRHEQGAGHAADGYARATKKPGVILATSGPGATNLVTALATAYYDSIPLVAITGQVETYLIGTDAFQEADITGITYPVTKHNYLVKDVKDLARTVKEAFFIATTGRPGPVLIDIPVDVAKGKTIYKPIEKVEIRSYEPNYEGHPGQIKKALDMIKEAKQPLILVGGGVVCSQASEEVRELVQKSGIPVASTLMGLGAIASDEPLFLGYIGMHGTVFGNYAIMDSDLLICIGARFTDRVTGKPSTFAPNAKVIHIDIDPSSIGKNIEAHLPIVGDAKAVLKQMNKGIEKTKIDTWLNKVMQWKKEYPLTYVNSQEVIKPQYVLELINELTQGQKTIFTTEVGQHQMWAAQFLKLNRPNQLLTSGGLGTMGYGLPSTIGAQIGVPDALCICIAGDGSIQMNIQELATIRNYNLPVKIVILNNMYLGMVRQWQELFFNKRYSATCLSRDKLCPELCSGEACVKYVPDFSLLAQAYHLSAYRIDKVSELKDKLKQAILDDKGPAIIDIYISREENVMPMVPAGHPINNIIQKYE